MESIMPTSTAPLRGKMTSLGLPILFLMVYISVPSVVAQYNCDKYCFDSCSDYFPGGEFSACVSARVHCSCHTKMSPKNPFVIFIIVACVFVTLFCCGVCYRLAKYNNSNSRPNPHRTIAHPIQSTVVSAGNNNRRNSSNNTSANNNNRQSQGGLRGFTNPLAPQKSNDFPPEYMAPPPYNECVIDMNLQEKSEKF